MQVICNKYVHHQNNGSRGGKMAELAVLVENLGWFLAPHGCSYPSVLAVLRDPVPSLVIGMYQACMLYKHMHADQTPIHIN